MNTSKRLDSKLLHILKSHIQFAFVEQEGLHIRIEWVEKDEATIKALKEWLLK